MKTTRPVFALTALLLAASLFGILTTLVAFAAACHGGSVVTLVVVAATTAGAIAGFVALERAHDAALATSRTARSAR